jgi:hypothetical protein
LKVTPVISQGSRYVDDLLRDAKLIADFGLRAGLFEDAGLYSAIAEVDRLPEKEPWAPEVTALQLEMNKAANKVPFAMLVELRNGWTPGESGKVRVRLTVLLVISVVLMIAAGHLSQIYNRGIALISEINALSIADPDRRFGQLTRQLVAARREIALADADELGKDTLKQQAYFQIYDDLRDLDQKLDSLVIRVEKYEDEASYPLFGSWVFWDAYYGLQRYFGYADQQALDYFNKRARPNLPYASDAAAAGNSNSISDLLKNIRESIINFSGFRAESDLSVCSQAKTSETYIEAQVTYIINKFGDKDNFPRMMREYANSNIYMLCFEYIKYNPYYIPSMDALSQKVGERVSPYALWVLPGLFGAIGAIIFHLRMILDPLKPHPSPFRIIHRVALGSLAGMVLAWFWVPETRYGMDLANIGFGLFGLAFVFGFSLDIFFTMLDRFVNLSNTAIGNIGSSGSTRS